MTINEIRLKNLEMIINTQFGGVRSRLAEALGIESTYLSRFYAEGTAKRNIGDKFARKVEDVGEKPHGWLDVEHGVVKESAGKYEIDEGVDWDKFAYILETVKKVLNEEGIDVTMGDMLGIADIIYDMDSDSAPKRSTIIRLYDFKKKAAGG